jgi:tetratricopeptide (TPR) repeat protein
MSLMHDALKEMDKPRPDRGLGAVSAMPAPARSIANDADTNAPEWQLAKINADARADAYSDEGRAQSKITLIAWLMGAVLFVVLGALWWVQSRQSQQVVSAVEGVATLNPAPKSLVALPSPALAPVSQTPLVPPVPPLLEPTTALAVSPITPMPASPAPVTQPAIAIASSVLPLSGAATQITPVSSSVPATAPPILHVPAPPQKLAVAAVSTTAPPPIVRESVKGMAVSTKDVPRSRTAILSTTTLPQPDSATPDVASDAPSKALSYSASAPDAVKENKIAATAAMPTSVLSAIAPVSDTPKVPTLSAKQLAAQTNAVAKEAMRKEAEATQTALARVAASKNASARYAAIGRALETGDRAAAQNALNSLEQELPASSLTLLRARAWVAGSGSDIVAARNAYSAILARLPEDENALLNMAALEAKDGKMDIARTLIAQALSANPESAAAKAAHQRLAVLTAQVR